MDAVGVRRLGFAILLSALHAIQDNNGVEEAREWLFHSTMAEAILEQIGASRDDLPQVLERLKGNKLKLGHIRGWKTKHASE